MPSRTLSTLFIILVALTALPVNGGAEWTAQDASEALRKAVEFFRTEVSTQGGYLWRYSADLERREGEGKATASMAWVQAPGTPAVGEAYLDAYSLTGDAYYLDAAKETAYALVKGQLRSGGWDYTIEFDPERRKEWAYRVTPCGEEGRNTTTLDDDNTQSAVRYLMKVDRALEFQDAAIHEAVLYALDALLKAQYPNGAWPQRFDAPPDPEKYPVKKASYPDTWTREFPKRDYKSDYTFNDNTIADTVETMFLAAEILGDARYAEAARRAGDFILLAQMPDPQPAWAQQYDADMHPSWARKFEPPAVTGGESHGAMQTLLDIYRHTADPKYLEPIPRALAYLKASKLPDGRLARFYELQTNKPLYFTKDYRITYDNGDMPTHYCFITGSWLEAFETQYEKLKDLDPAHLDTNKKSAKPEMTEALTAQAKAIVESMDERGAWVEDGRLRYHGEEDPTRRIIDSATFAKNIRLLSRYIAAAR